MKGKDNKKIVEPPKLLVDYETYNIKFPDGKKQDVTIPVIECPFCQDGTLEVYEDCVHCTQCAFFHLLTTKRMRTRLREEYPDVYDVYIQEKNAGDLTRHSVVYQDNLDKTYGKYNEPSVEEITAMKAFEKDVAIKDDVIETTIFAPAEDEAPPEHTRPLHFEDLSIGDFEFNEAENLITSYLNFEDEDIMFGIAVTTEEVKEEKYASFGTIEFYNKEQVDKLLKKYSYDDLQYFIKMMWNFEYSIEYV